MADGRTRAIATRVGDDLRHAPRGGTAATSPRRCSPTGGGQAAYRVTLADGTELVASGDHRFLTERGWKHVTGAEWRPDVGRT